MKELLTAGKIVNTHSLRGEVRIYPYCDSADFLCEFDKFYIDGNSMDVISSRVHKGQALVKFDGINDINEAKKLVGKLVSINRNDIELEEGRYFIEDIKGMSVIDADSNKEYGKVTNVIATGANDVFEVTGADGKTVLIPKIDDVIKKIDIENGIILITPIKGLLE